MSKVSKNQISSLEVVMMRINIYWRRILGDPYLEMSSSDSGSNRQAYVLEKWDATNEARRLLVDVRFS